MLRRLRRMLAWDELKRTKAGTWPPAVTLPRLGGSPPAL
jgi:hypothetical protein